MTSPPQTAPEPPQILARDDGETIAYRKREADPAKAGAAHHPTIVFLCGFRSDMGGTKAEALHAFCAERGQAFLRFDYFGHGASSGNFAAGTIGRWADDAVAALDALTTGPLVLVGSSMGGWIMLLAARARRDRIRAMIGIAAAPDFTRDMMERELTAAQRKALLRDGVIDLPSEYDEEPTPLSLAFIENGNRHLLLDAPIPFDGPVRLLNGLKDTDVPWQTSLAIAERLTTADVHITLVKDGDHRLSTPKDIAGMLRTVAEVSNLVQGG